MIRIINPGLYYGVRWMHLLAIEFQRSCQSLSGYLNDFRDVNNTVFRHLWWEMLHPGDELHHFSAVINFWKTNNLLFIQAFQNTNDESLEKIDLEKKPDKRFKSAD